MVVRIFILPFAVSLDPFKKHVFANLLISPNKVFPQVRIVDRPAIYVSPAQADPSSQGSVTADHVLRIRSDYEPVNAFKAFMFWAELQCVDAGVQLHPVASRSGKARRCMLANDFFVARFID